jgi:Xaa-Pro aminopeptidase
MALSTPDGFAGIRRHAARRTALFDRLGDGLLILPTAPMRRRNGDVEFPHRADSDLVYLTGFPEPHAILVAWRNGRSHGERLYVQPRDAQREIWDGPRYGTAGTKKQFGVAAFPVSTFFEQIPDLIAAHALQPGASLFHTLGHEPEFDRRLLAACRTAAAKKRRQAPPAHPPLVDPRPALAHQRLVKDEHELEMLRLAGEVSAAAHLEAMRFAKPGMREFQVQAVLERTFRHFGSKRNGYESICASGPNACVLHYVMNDRELRPGDLMLIDAGAEVGFYTADITRTFPVGGTFSEPQRAVYSVVLRAQRAAIRAVRAGRPSDSAHTTAMREITKGLVELGVIGRGEPTAAKVRKLVEEKAYQPFFMHGTSHWLGLDVHDAGTYQDAAGKPIRYEPGMVLTIEPGLYFGPRDRAVPKEFRGIGVRIEDDVVVRADGPPEVLTGDVPTAVAAIERECAYGRTALH